MVDLVTAVGIVAGVGMVVMMVIILGIIVLEVRRDRQPPVPPSTVDEMPDEWETLADENGDDHESDEVGAGEK